MTADKPKRILVVAPSWIGDMVMAQSLLIRIRREDPSVHITVFAPAWCLPLLERMPQIDRTVANVFGHGQLRLAERRKCARELAEDRYDLALVLPHSLKSALIPFMAKIPLRRGWLGEMRYILLNQRYRDKKPMPHLVAQYNALAWDPRDFSPDLVAECPNPQLTAHPEAAPEILARFGISSEGPALGLCPGAEYGPAKRWPETHFARAAAIWIRRGGSVHIFGGPKDKPVAEAIRAVLPGELRERCHVVAGLTTLPEVADLLSACRGVITNDSGLMHVAAAVGTPLVAVYGSSTTDYTPPLSDRAVALYLKDLSCRPCFKRQCPLGHARCLADISPERVMEALDGLLGRAEDAR